MAAGIIEKSNNGLFENRFFKSPLLGSRIRKQETTKAG